MKKVLLLIFTFLIAGIGFSQKTFCEGWEDGYEIGKTSLNEFVGITPLCPLPKINADTYEIGYQLGYEKATGKKTNVMLISDDSERNFCDGWEDGYQSGKTMLNENVGLTPLCPIPSINKDSYEIGYQLGYERATGTAEKANVNVVMIKSESESEKSFCDGWEKGYSSGMNSNGEYNFFIPICPLPGINEDNYESGYIKGLASANKKLGLETSPTITINDPDATFCEGWEKGYQIGLQLWAQEHNAITPLRITPICPIPGINADSYLSGFERGKAKALTDLGD